MTRLTFARNNEQSEWHARAALSVAVGVCDVAVMRAVLCDGFRARGALCTATQRIGQMVWKAPHRGRDSLSLRWNLEKAHDSGQHHYRPKGFDTRDAAAGDHSAEAAKPRRRQVLVTS